MATRSQSTSSDEREFLGSFVKDQKKYGSTASHKTERFTTHYVQPEDTLQGLALKYGVTMEHIKRANKLWTDDSLFLRPTLNIPLLGETNDGDLFKTPPYSSSSSQDSSPKRKNSRATQVATSSKHNSSVVDCQDEITLDSPESCRSQNGATSQGSSSGKTVAAVASQKEESVLDFLMRIDSSISKTKDQVMERETKLNTKYSENDLFRISNGTTRPSSSLAQRHSLSSLNPSESGSRTSLHSNGHGGGDHSPIVITKGRKVKYSLKRLERKQDELFEL